MKEITWHPSLVTKHARCQRSGHLAFAVWLTGLSGSGKSTLATTLEKDLFERGYTCYHLDGDNLRHGLNNDLGFSAADRKENIRRASEVARLMVDAGTIVITAFISPYREDRSRARALFEPGEFIEVYLKCPLATCEGRDSKGLYAKARSGEIKDFTGIHMPYEEPERAELVLDTDALPFPECARRVCEELKRRGLII